jgi:hypothetical protein
LKLQGDFDALMQGVNTYGDKKRRSSQRRRLKVFADDIRDRAAVGDDGIHHPDGSRLKPREVDQLIKNMIKGEFTVTGDQMRTHANGSMITVRFWPRRISRLPPASP